MADYTILQAMHRPVHNGDAFSRHHPKMERGNRAKIFAPFDALTGFDETMGAETICTVHPAELSSEMRQELDIKMQWLSGRYKELPAKRADRKHQLEISVLYFEIDPEQTMLHNDGIRGNYRWLSGDILEIDPVRGTVDLGGRRLEAARIYAIEA